MTTRSPWAAPASWVSAIPGPYARARFRQAPFAAQYRGCEGISKWLRRILPRAPLRAGPALPIEEAGPRSTSSLGAADMSDIVIVSAARTPVGSFNGALSGLPAHELGKVAIQAAVERAGIQMSDV